MLTSRSVLTNFVTAYLASGSPFELGFEYSHPSHWCWVSTPSALMLSNLIYLCVKKQCLSSGFYWCLPGRSMHIISLSPSISLPIFYKALPSDDSTYGRWTQRRPSYEWFKFPGLAVIVLFWVIKWLQAVSDRHAWEGNAWIQKTVRAAREQIISDSRGVDKAVGIKLMGDAEN